MIDRRQLLAGSAATLAYAGLAAAFEGPARAAEASLVPDPRGMLDLASGFSYALISTQGAAMSDGLITPGRFDGMAAFPRSGGGTILVRNHELWPEVDTGPFGARHRLLTKTLRAKLFDASQPSIGGTTTLLLSRDGRVEESWLSLCGTMRNCSGGATPWNSWLTCEEPRRGLKRSIEDGHGWVFEVPADHRGLVDPVPLKGLGRLNHEAAAVDPRTGIVYMTEDRDDGLFYRFLPAEPRNLRAGGRLQALALDGGGDTDNENGGWAVGATRTARWIELADPEAPDDDLRLRGHAAGAARLARGEGLAYGSEGVVYIACTSGGRAEKGQVFRYTPSRDEGQTSERDAPGTLTLFLEPNDASLLDLPDNLAVHPTGLLIVCEDGGGDNYIRAVTRTGAVHVLAKNADPRDKEFCGACFSPDGGTLFVNVQDPGRTFAVTGDWRRSAMAAPVSSS